MWPEEIIKSLCVFKSRSTNPQRIEFNLLPHKTTSRFVIHQLCDAIESYTNDLMYDEISWTIDSCQVDTSFLKNVLRSKKINAKITLAH